MIHKNINGKAKCGARSYSRYSFLLLSTEDSAVNCKKCLGTVKREVNFAPIEGNMIGTIFHTSWGYDMTINEYVKVISQTEKSLLVKECYTAMKGSAYNPGGGEASCGEIKPGGKEFKIFRKVRNYKDYRGQPATYEYWVGKLHTSATSWGIWDGQPNYENHLD